MLFTKLIKRFISIGANAGKKGAGPEPSGKLYTLYDTCDRCPLRVYVDVVCYDNLASLIVEGDAPPYALIRAKNALIEEFSILCKNAFTKASNEHMRKIYLYRSQLIALSLCSNFIDDDACVDYLRSIGIKISAPITADNADRARKIVNSRIKQMSIRLKSEIDAYNKLADGAPAAKPTRENFTEQLVIISRHVGFRLTNDITLAEYAAYINDFQNSLKNGRNNK